SFGIGGITVASVTALAAMTLLPALLSVMGQRINALSLPGLRRYRQRNASLPENPSTPTFWHTWALFVMKRPIIILLFTVAMLIGLSWPALALNPGLPGAASLPADSQARH